MKDTYDLQISTNAAAGGLFNQALRSLAGFDADVVERAQGVREADPGFALGHCVFGYVT